FGPATRAFGWMPFRSFFRSTVHAGIVNFFEKMFMYGSLVWLLRKAGLPSRSGTAFAAGLVLVLRMLQVYLPGRSAEITDVVILLIMAALMRLLSEDPWLDTPMSPSGDGGESLAMAKR